MAHPEEPRRGQRLSARALNALSAFARAIGHLEVVAPLRLLPTGSGRALSLGPDARNRPIFARLGGLAGAGTSPYSWTEQRWRDATHDWEDKPGGRTGTTNAYELNDFAGLGTMVVPIYRMPGGTEFLFRWNQIVTPPPPPVECSNCMIYWPSTLTNAIGAASVTLTKVTGSSGGVGYVGCQMISGVSGWTYNLTYGCAGYVTCDVPLFWFLNCESEVPGRSKRVVISCYYYAYPGSTTPHDPLEPCPAPPPRGTPMCTVKCNGPNGVALGPVAAIGDCSSLAPGCSPWGFNVGVNCGGFFGSVQPCPQDFIQNGSSFVDLPDDFDCHGAIDLLFPALTTFPYSILTGTPHVTG